MARVLRDSSRVCHLPTLHASRPGSRQRVGHPVRPGSPCPVPVPRQDVPSPGRGRRVVRLVRRAWFSPSSRRQDGPWERPHPPPVGSSFTPSGPGHGRPVPPPPTNDSPRVSPVCGSPRPVPVTDRPTTGGLCEDPEETTDPSPVVSRHSNYATDSARFRETGGRRAFRGTQIVALWFGWSETVRVAGVPGAGVVVPVRGGAGAARLRGGGLLKEEGRVWGDPSREDTGVGTAGEACRSEIAPRRGGRGGRRASRWGGRRGRLTPPTHPGRHRGGWALRPRSEGRSSGTGTVRVDSAPEWVPAGPRSTRRTEGVAVGPPPGSVRRPDGTRPSSWEGVGTPSSAGRPTFPRA